MLVKEQKFLVLGVSKSGYAVAKKVLSLGGECFLFEQLQNENVKQKIDELVSSGATIVNEEDVDKVISQIDVVVISPGVPINHAVAVSAKRKGKRIMGEMEFGLELLMPTIVAVTGTNGKTTTCTMIETIIKEAQKPVCLLGNIGTPITAKIQEITPETICVTEVSSFQLESTLNLKPHVCCVLNIAPDHLERHYTMDNYIYLKKRIFKNQKESEFCVLNYDDQTVKGFYEECRANVVWVSVKEKVEGAYLLDGVLYYKSQAIINQNELPISGLHNVYNALFAIAVCSLLGIEEQVIANALKNLKGVKHRIEFVENINGVDYFNDSKATNVASTITAIESMQKPTVLILGGSEKGEKYDLLFEKIKTSLIKHVVLTGKSRYSMLDDAGKVGYTDLTITPDFDFAVKVSKMLAKDGECVLLSPACASFDSFENYEQRGDRFCKIVRGES